MPLDIIIGAQWGDEGKWRVTDLLASKADIVARFNGGDNAGHTVTIGGDIYRLSLIPCGIVNEGTICILGNGMVVNPAVLIREIDSLEARGVNVQPHRLQLSNRAHLITPGHVALDKFAEIARRGKAIGTTQRGIGPAYTEKAARIGLRTGLFIEPEALSDAISDHIEKTNVVLRDVPGMKPLDKHEIAVEFTKYARRLAPYLIDCSFTLNQALNQKKSILAEGAQGILLDIDHGTYPFVTSSWPTAGGALIGLGLGPKTVRKVIGVAKAFTTRVGSGPFPCEIEGPDADLLRGTGENPWDEFGTTTGRPRRVGWLDTVILKYASNVNGFTELVLTKLDILSGFQQLPVCVAYELDGQRHHTIPADHKIFAKCKPVYQTLPGWTEDVSGARRPQDLPANALRYIRFISDAVGVPIRLASVGPGREQIVDFTD
jgi:adenylosuccinate synthase